MNLRHPERLVREQRLRTSREFSAVKAAGTPFRGRYCLLVVLACPGEPTRVGFVAGKRGVGGAVERNRARRRLREIVRRRWSRVAGRGWWMMFIAERSALGAPHALLAAEVERLLAGAGVLAPAAEAGR
ncbi:MAG TPA: ribonuclease P protein component [Candidatus Eisenbacteria bacterium]|jgi:ribonuclease P protein component